MIVSPAFADKKFALLGLARSGQSAVRALVESGAQVTAWDNRAEARDAVSDIASIADPMEIDLSVFDALVVSPGVPLNSHPIADKAKQANVPIIGDIELFAIARQSLPAHKIVGITGTNGKSTVTALVHHMLKSAARPTRIGGNFGLPILSQEPLAAGGVYVLELSSYQIDLSYSLDCDVAALLNISPDHLDRYDGFDGYKKSKARLFDLQSQGHASIFGNGDADTIQIAEDVALRKPAGNIHTPEATDLAGQEDWPSLQGPHNLQNASLAVAIVECLGLTEAQWRPALESFKGLSHRMEIVGEYNGVLYVNDSKATNPASTAPALAAFSKIHWIVGGKPKGVGLDECASAFGNVVKAYTVGEAGHAYAQLLEPKMPVSNCEMIAEAVAQASKTAKTGEVILLSPACASFDQFKDFEARGDAFKAAVHHVVGIGNA